MKNILDFIKNNDSKIKNVLFQTAMCILFAQVYLIGTTVTLPNIRLTLPAFGLIILSVFIPFNYSVKRIVISAAILLSGAYIALSTKNNNALWIAILLTFSYGVDIKGLMKKMLAVLSIIYFLAMILAMLGIIPDLTREASAVPGVIKHSMGINDANGNHAFYLIIVSLIIFLFYQKMKLWHYAVLFIFNIALYKLTICRTAMLIVALELAGTYILQKLADKKEFEKVFQYLMLAADIGIVGIIIILIHASINFNWQTPWIIKLNDFLTGRLWLGYDFFTRYPINLFGNYMPDLIGQTAVLDIGYCVLLLQYGAVFLIFYLIMNIMLLHNFRINKQFGPYVAVMAILLHMCTENLMLIPFYNFTFFWISELLFKDRE